MGWMLSYDYGEPCLTHSGLVENYTSNMLIFPESGIGIAVLVNRNDCFVGNSILGNVIMPLLGEEKQEFSVNPYIGYHIIIDLIYLLLLIIAIYPLISIGRRKKMKHTKKLAAADIIRHGILPVILLGLSGFLGVPLWVVWYFVKDLFIVLTVSAALLLGTGVYKAAFFIRHRNYR